ncbi:MAG: 4Fe-4S binding protein, partial [Candidatus Aminicenantes bacterium]|nr:4Fe-4S binding protein [Candidatus Aminicenantes bacterium]
STATPSVKKKKCTGCGACLAWCPAGAISMAGGVAGIDRKACIGCAECLTVCRFDAIGYNWAETYERLQRKITEHAWGVAEAKKGRALYINFLTRISKDCDCMGGYHKILPDIGVLLASDPVALDAASLDLVEERAGRPLGALAYDIPCRVQIDHARELGFGNPDYRIIQAP